MNDDQAGQRTVIEHLARTFARGLVIAGGAFWVIATFGVPLAFPGTSTIDASIGMWPFLAILVILVIGWRYERLAAVLLVAASLVIVAFGFIYEWESGMWIVMGAAIIAPMALAAVLFALSARAEDRRSAAEAAAAASAASEASGRPVPPAH
jgi:hypothetical protein